MEQNLELKALETVKAELEKIYDRYKVRAEKERSKVNDVHVLIQGEKCYTECEINSWMEADYITSTQADKYIEKLEAKRRKAGEEGTLTKSECICKMLKNTITNYAEEIKEVKYTIEQEEKRRERWEIAQKQGCSYAEWLEQEEISRQSEEYEKRVLHQKFKVI